MPGPHSVPGPMRTLVAVQTSKHSVSASLCAALVLLTGCGGGGGGGTTNPPPVGAFTMSASGSALTIARNGSASLTITIVRSGGFTGSVSLLPTQAPTGVTVGFVPPQISAAETQSVMTVNVGGATATGTTTFRVSGTSVGVSMQTVDITLTVTAQPVQTGPFTLSSSATSFLVYPSGQLNANPIITIARNAGFTGSVTFTVSGLPTLLILGFSPGNTTGNTVTALIFNAGTPNGVYTATIRGASAQGDQSVTIQIHVMSASTGTIKWKFCSGSTSRYFVAVKDGNGPWTRLQPAADTSFSFNVTSGSASLAEVTIDSGGFRTTVYQYTAQEMAARAAAQCALVQNVTTRTVNGSFGGVTGSRTSQVGMGWWFSSANGNGSFALLNLPPGPLDVIAARNGDFVTAVSIPVDRMIIRRGLNPASGGSLPVLDFNAAESFAPTTATWTFGNLNGEQFSVGQAFTTAGGSTGHLTLMPGLDGVPAARTIYGAPVANTVVGDLHQVIATVATVGVVPGGPVRATRQIVAYGRALGDRALSFGPPMLPAAVTPIATAPAGRLRAQGMIPVEYNTGVTWDISQTGTARFFTVHASRGFLGAGNLYDLQMPDFSAAIGWDTQFAIRAGIATNWWVSGGGPTLDFFDGRYIFNSTRSRWTGIMTGIVAPADGATYLMARTVGSATP